jgi:protein TonB
MLRFPIAMAISVVVVMALFWLMHAATAMREVPTDVQRAVKIEFSRLRREGVVEPRKRGKPPRQEPKPQPAAPGMVVAKNLDAEQVTNDLMAMVTPGVGAGDGASFGPFGGGGGGSSGGDGGSGSRDALPLVRIDPEYPPRAQQQGLKGWVVVEFTISPAGTVKDARVVQSEPPYVFDQASLDAIRRWRYNPRVENGVAVAQTGVFFRFRFDGVGRGR